MTAEMMDTAYIVEGCVIIIIGITSVIGFYIWQQQKNNSNTNGFASGGFTQTDGFASHSSQPFAANPNPVPESHSNSHAAATGKQTASTVLLPFSGELTVDKKLKLSNDDFKQSIEKFYVNKQFSAIDQLKATPPYPTPHVLAQFANMAYGDFKRADPEPPAGWQFLTTASNFGNKNGYFGAAYWHPEHQQVVIAHRGTDTNNNISEFLNCFYTDLKGVLYNKYVPKMSSASTFANKVVAVLQEIEKEQNVSFEIFFTGHSLGGWLAQITTFTTEYLEVKVDTFLMQQKTEEHAPANSTVQDSHYTTHSYHPHALVFDSPGCEDMLRQMAGKLDVKLHGRSIDLQHLDITSYLSAPNLINTCNSHLGTVYRIFVDLSDMSFIEQNTPLYNLATHSMDKILQAFNPEMGQVRKDEKGDPKILEVVDWPVRAGRHNGQELNEFFKWAEYLNNYHPQVLDIEYSGVPNGYHPLPYQTKDYNEYIKSLRVFTTEEREFLQFYCSLRNTWENFEPESLFHPMKDTDAQKQAKLKLQNFEVSNEFIYCDDTSRFNTLIPYVKRLLRLFPHIGKNLSLICRHPAN